ncbi:MAG: hypothetical protein IIB08_04355 [Bacteroidetes bacterium]|nr:hypothetical protein [Bacteroidota bacterium]
MVQVYQKKWERSWVAAFVGYIRDVVVLYLPIKRLPRALVKILYGVDAKFAFLVHPRAYQDIFISAPFFKPIKMLFRKSTAHRFFSSTPPFVLSTMTTKQGVNGIVIAQQTLPELLFQDRKKALKNLKKAIKLFSKFLRQ